ncbi:MAG: uracil-DNA glycosylase [Anaerolineae bacterium]|nr:uracil-DNA glycosylase [Anaerolineae bacterium]
MDIDPTIDSILHALMIAPTAEDAYNEYAAHDPNNAIRRENFRLYLRHMQARQPKTMLVMEAPGYRGCRLTGVPVTSRKVLLEGVPELDFFGEEKGYHLTHDPEFENVYGEQSATIVWGTLAQLGHLPLIWNTFPFHPHKAGKPLTNRPPRAPEKALGAHFLEAMLTLFQPKQVIAIGNVAHDTLSKIGLECAKVRHPAQGGKNDFVAGLTELLGN